MTETSYTAWDDKLYQWPPPDGWYEADDGKWWPEGYGPGPAGSGDDAAEADATTAGTEDVAVAGGGPFGGDASIGGLGAAAVGGATGAFAGGLDAAADAVGSGLPGADEVSGAISDRLGEGAGGVSSGGLSDRFEAAASSGREAAADAIPDVDGGGLADPFADASGSATEAVGDAIPERAADAVAGLGPFGSDAIADAASTAGDAAEGLLGGATGASTAFDAPDGDDVGAALAETMSARSDDPADPASSGIAGFTDPGRAEFGSAADAAADASQFLTADIPAYDPEAAGERPPTDLDALPPPTFSPPGFEEAPPAAADDLADLAEPFGQGPTAAPTDAPPESSPLFSTSTAPDGPAPPDDDRLPAPSIDGFQPPPDETLPPALAGSGSAEPYTPDPAAGFGQPDETMVAPLGGSAFGEVEDRPASSEISPNPAETGQFNPSPPGPGTAWDAPPPGQFNVPPPQVEPPGSMPWGQGGAPGAPGVPGGFEPAGLPAPEGGSGSSRTLLLVGLGVAALVLLGVAAYLLFGDDSDGGTTAVATGPGSLAEPHDRTTPVEVFYPTGDTEQRFVIEVLEPVRDASGQADGAPPADGDRFAVTRVRVTNQTTADAPVSDLRFNAVTAAGNVIDRESNSCAITEPGLDFGTVLGQAGVAEGVVCWVVPATDLEGLLLGIESTKVSGRIHIKLQ